jgi:hypothetical protein
MVIITENTMLIQKHKTKRFNLIRSLREIEQLTKTLPDEHTCYKFISLGGFSSISFIKFIADRTKINFMFASTLRIGRKHLWILDELHRVNKLGACEFVIGSIMKDDSESGKSYRYYDDLEKVCAANNWQATVTNNHSKILLFDTDAGKYVIETSSNLNENPKFEQFSFEKDAELYDFYLGAFRGDIIGQRGKDN